MFPGLPAGNPGANPADALSQSTLGRYQMIRRLATGGMAELYLARAQGAHGFEKLVVLKRILPQHAESEDFIRMFLTEARLAATLHHPNIAQVYDIGEEGGTHFFTMEYVQGQDLRRLVRAARKQQKPIPLEHILHIIMGVAAGLHHAHDKVGMDGKPLNIVHRDVSPSNVLVTYEGDIKIVDFGIAKAATAQVATIAGTLKGKIPYMSPEQCRGEMVDRRSDIFSIGTLLWELTTGKRLFAGDNEFAILNRVAKGDVPLPSSIRPDYPPELEAIVMRALQPDPDSRYNTAQDLQIDIEDFAREARLPVSSARMSRFMGELFFEEIRDNAEEVSREQPPMPSMVSNVHALGPQTPVAGVPMSAPGMGMGMGTGTGMRVGMGTGPGLGHPMEMDGQEYTPSELRQPGVATGAGGSYGTDTTNAGADPALDEVPGRMRSGPLIAIGAGFLAAAAIAAVAVWAFKHADDDREPPPPTVIRSEDPEPEPDELPDFEAPTPEASEVAAPLGAPFESGLPPETAVDGVEPSEPAAADSADPDPGVAPQVEPAPTEPDPPPTPAALPPAGDPKPSTKPAAVPPSARKPPAPKRPRKPKEEAKPKKPGINDLPDL